MPKETQKDDDARKERQDRAESVRRAAAQAVAAAAGQAQSTRGRAQGLADDLVGAAGRVRGALEDLRPPTADDIRDLRARLDALEQRVGELEAGASPPAGGSGAARSRARRSSSS